MATVNTEVSTTAAPRLRLNCERLIAAAEKEGDVTRQKIASRAGIEQTTLWRLYGGNVVPSVATLVALRDAYGLETIDELLLTVPAQRDAA